LAPHLIFVENARSDIGKANQRFDRHWNPGEALYRSWHYTNKCSGEGASRGDQPNMRGHMSSLTTRMIESQILGFGRRNMRLK
jgi:hypothetical protein